MSNIRILQASDESIEEACKILEGGGVVAHATETSYGLACDMTNLEAVEKLFAIKHRKQDQPVSALFASIKDAKLYVNWNEEALFYAEKYLPGPLTIIVPLAESKVFPSPKGGGSLGVRISSHVTAQKLAEAYGKPISTTSANISGKDSCFSADDIMNQFAGEKYVPDLILDDGKLPTVPASVIIDATGTICTTIRGDLSSLTS